MAQLQAKERRKFAGRFEEEMRSAMSQIRSQQESNPSSRYRFAPVAQVALGGDGASHRVSQNDMPPLAGKQW
jgi:hypothetical protein